MACNDRQLTQAQREAAYQQQRTGVARAVRPFSGSATIENLIDYINRELGPAVRSTRDAINECFLQVADNAPSANPLAFYFSTSVAAADPTVGRIRLNQAVQNTATVMRVSQSNARLIDVQPWLDVMAGGPTTPLGVVTLVDAINPARFIRWDLNTMTDQGAYWDLGITVIESSDASPFVEDEAVTVGFISGVSAAGSTIPVGALTPIARDTFVGNITTGTAAPVAVPLASIDSTSIVYDATAHEMQRAALTGFAVATQNSNATTSAEPIVTFSASANMSNERVATSSTSVTVSTSVASQIEFQRAALSGAIAATANSNATLFAGIRDNGSAETDRTNLNFVSGDSNTAVITDDAANDELEVAYNYVGSTTNVNLTTLTGDQNVVDISTLRCGGSVTVESVSADYNIDGFTAKTDGFWFWLVDRRTSGSTMGELTEDNGATTTSIRNPGLVHSFVRAGDRVLFYYTNNRWRAAPVNSGTGRLIDVTEYITTSGTHTFDARTRKYIVELHAPSGGGGGANSAAAQCAVGASGGKGAYFRMYCDTVPVSEDYDTGTGGAGGDTAGGDGTSGTPATWSSGATLVTVPAGGGGEGSAHATRGSGSGTALGFTGPGGQGGVTLLVGGGGFPAGSTRMNFIPGEHGLPGTRISGTVGWGGGTNTSSSALANGLSMGALSLNNTDRGGSSGNIGRIAVWEFT